MSNKEIKEAQEIVNQLRNPKVLTRVIEMMKISDPLGILQIHAMVSGRRKY